MRARHGAVGVRPLRRRPAGRHRKLSIDGLWTLEFGNAGLDGDPQTLIFTAGIGDEAFRREWRAAAPAGSNRLSRWRDRSRSAAGLGPCRRERASRRSRA